MLGVACSFAIIFHVLILTRRHAHDAQQNVHFPTYGQYVQRSGGDGTVGAVRVGRTEGVLTWLGANGIPGLSLQGSIVNHTPHTLARREDLIEARLANFTLGMTSIILNAQPGTEPP